MELPFYSSKELWRHLGSSTIRFYTSATSSKIPDIPGIYAWLYPLDVDTDIDSSIHRLKKIFLYDATGNHHKNKTRLSHIQWQAVRQSLYLTSEYKVQETIEDNWASLSNDLEDKQFKALRQIITLSSIFTKPLYIGLAKNLSARYEQHVQGSKKNDFHARFIGHNEDHDIKLRVEDLIFATIPIEIPGSTEQQNKEIISCVEYILKNVIGPVYGER